MWCSHGEEQEAAEGVVVVLIIKELVVALQTQGDCVSLLQLQVGPTGEVLQARDLVMLEDA